MFHLYKTSDNKLLFLAQLTERSTVSAESLSTPKILYISKLGEAILMRFAAFCRKSYLLSMHWYFEKFVISWYVDFDNAKNGPKMKIFVFDFFKLFWIWHETTEYSKSVHEMFFCVSHFVFEIHQNFEILKFCNFSNSFDVNIYYRALNNSTWNFKPEYHL